MKKTTIDINESTIHKYVESISPEDLEIREKLDIGYSYDKNTVILFEIRPEWDNPKNKIQIEFAKIRYYKSRKEWNLYWMRSSGKWELYDPFPKSTHLAKIIATIKEDSHGCFFG